MVKDLRNLVIAAKFLLKTSASVDRFYKSTCCKGLTRGETVTTVWRDERKKSLNIVVEMIFKSSSGKLDSHDPNPIIQAHEDTIWHCLMCLDLDPLVHQLTASPHTSEDPPLSCLWSVAKGQTCFRLQSNGWAVTSLYVWKHAYTVGFELMLCVRMCEWLQVRLDHTGYGLSELRV